ncbi:hypothetical protein MSAN_02414800 [Mycena sanguinolenta]|uniref:Uncharacterized protein n=1 Tax=Mycena sanguinolenta TaxID=230812 RepID=A0A8H6X353_9AGAR|nr:hypothetical protein MSAN_02414800 [Mycena sanguinolenta]
MSDLLTSAIYLVTRAPAVYPDLIPTAHSQSFIAHVHIRRPTASSSAKESLHAVLSPFMRRRPRQGPPHTLSRVFGSTLRRAHARAQKARTPLRPTLERTIAFLVAPLRMLKATIDACHLNARLPALPRHPTRHRRARLHALLDPSPFPKCDTNNSRLRPVYAHNSLHIETSTDPNPPRVLFLSRGLAIASTAPFPQRPPATSTRIKCSTVPPQHQHCQAAHDHPAEAHHDARFVLKHHPTLPSIPARPLQYPRRPEVYIRGASRPLFRE